jgi:DNA polymerase (family 10)
VPSRADLDALPRVLATLAAAADIGGDRAGADALLEAVRRLEPQSTAERREYCRDTRRQAAPAAAPPVAAAVRRVLEQGAPAVAGAALAGLPADLATLLRTTDLDPLDLIRAHRRHGVVSGADVAAAAAIEETEGDAGEPALARLASWLPWLNERRPRLPLGRAMVLLERIEQACAGDRDAGEILPLGSVRRYEPTVGDVELLVVHPSPANALTAAVRCLAPEIVRHHGDTRAVLTLGREEVGLRAVSPVEAPLVQLWHTGSAPHVVGLRRRARERGFDLRPRALRSAGGEVLACVSERDVYEQLGLAFVPPELRHGEDELRLAERGAMPRLLDVGDIRGDLHTHTLWSDGRDTIDTIVYAARALGYEYVAITDHSPSAAAPRVLTPRKIEEQMAEVERVRTRIPDIAVLYGVEVDILPDGTLDLADDLLDRLDLVLASLHEPMGHGPGRLLQRYERALHDPRVGIVTHPANRLPGRDEGYPIDFDALFRLAAETGTALEIDGGPAHLDLDGRLARRAVDAGVTLCVDSDCHNALRLGLQMRMGVGTARRGGVEASHVLNTRPVEDVLAFLAAKRRRGDGGVQVLRGAGPGPA